MPEPGRPNRLARESSPYLRQHAHNPVDWYPWGPEAWERARRENRPILLSVGYSACHWCHVMERESFEDERIAAAMNERFVNVKVDREERPDLDEIYMAAVQAMTGSGGWPMTVFLTPDLRPFYGGTYFPPEDRHGLPGFPRLLEAVSEHYRAHREQVEARAAELTTSLAHSSAWAGGADPVGAEVLDQAFVQLRSGFDRQHGGFGPAPKFPAGAAISFLLRYRRRAGRSEALDMAVATLRAMAMGGIYDHLGGGFHRYSTDARWLVPHFEKMLYDNALLTWAYLEAHQATGEPLFAQVVRQTLAYVEREMTRPGGGFYATQDADSEGEEGRYYVWEPAEVERLLDPPDDRLFMRYYDVTAKGNFDGGGSILHVTAPADRLASFLKVDAAQLEAAVAAGRDRLFAARQGRVPPGRDEKIIAAWNGLMISAMARAHQVLGEDRWLRAAREAAEFVLGPMVGPEGLMHSWKDGRPGHVALQDDYASMIVALLDLYEADFGPRWLSVARAWADRMLERFWDPERGGFYLTAPDAADLIVRTKSNYDGATPSGNSLAATGLLRLAAITGDHRYRRRAEETLRAAGPLLRRAPTGCAQMLCALDLALDDLCRVAVVGAVADRGPLLRAVRGRFLPNKVVMAVDPTAGWGEATGHLELVAGQPTGDDGAPRAYVCRDTHCEPPVEDPEALVSLLEVRRDG